MADLLDSPGGKLVAGGTVVGGSAIAGALLAIGSQTAELDHLQSSVNLLATDVKELRAELRHVPSVLVRVELLEGRFEQFAAQLREVERRGP